VCRLFGYVATHPTTVEATLGTRVLEQFSRLSRLHGDGWGTAWFDPEAPRELGQRTYRSPRPAHSDPAFAQQTGTEPSRARIVHLRWASPGLRVRSENTHPFFVDGMSFAHNGSLMPPATVEQLLEPESVASLVGATDSERYFALVRQELRRCGGDTVVAVARSVRMLRARFPIASLNALVLSSDELVVVHANSIEDAPTPEQLPTGGRTPPDHLDAYYLMRWRFTAGGTLAVTSSGLPDDGWVPFPDNSITRVDLSDLSAMTVDCLDAVLDLRPNLTAAAPRPAASPRATPSRRQ